MLVSTQKKRKQAILNGKTSKIFLGRSQKSIIMNNNHNGIKTDLQAHPDVFIPRDVIYVDNDDGNYIDDDQPRIRSNSGGSFERTNRFDMVHQTTLSQSYGGDGFSSFLLRQDKGLPSSRAQRYVHVLENFVVVKIQVVSSQHSTAS